MKRWVRVVALIGVTAISSVEMYGQSKSSPEENWVATWATSQDMAPTTPDRPVLPADMKRPDFQNMKGAKRPSPNIPTGVQDQTVRMVVHSSIGGQKVRIELANAFGKSTISIGSAHVAVAMSGGGIDSHTDRQLTFSGSQSVEMRPGSILVSDPVDFDVQPMSNLAISLFVVNGEGIPTNHALGLHTSYISKGDTTTSASMPEPSTTTAYLWLRSVDVAAGRNDFAIACLGDSITDGFQTTVDADQAWPTLLARRLSEEKGGPRVAVLNQGISGNQVLRDGAGVSALARFDRDVLSEPGVRWVVMLEGINDINLHGQITSKGGLVPGDLIGGYKQIIARAHMQNIKVAGATLTPDAGVWLAGPVGEVTRQKVNEWIRTSEAFDAVIDFDAITRDHADPTRLQTAFDSDDHIHPNDRGNAAMADAISLKYFLPKAK
jgi:lysophospholipase L1-like esterase